MRFYAATGLIKENRSDGWRCVTFSDFSTGMDHSCCLLEQFSSYIILTRSSTLRNNLRYVGCLRIVMILQVGIAVDAVVLESHARAGAAKCVPGHFGWMVLDENPRSMKILVVGRRWPPQDASVRYMQQA
jgi:hypothetical protein